MKLARRTRPRLLPPPCGCDLCDLSDRSPLEWAIEHARRGLAVYPIVEGKGTARCRWGDEATDKVKVIKRKGWWQGDGHRDGIGIHCQRSRIKPVDIDPRNDGWKTLYSQIGPQPFITVSPHTGRIGDRPISRYAPLGDTGTHWYFEAPEEPLRNGKALGPGIDVLGAGLNDNNGLPVVAPGSRHYTGGVYHWAEGLGPDDVDFAPFPEVLAQLLRPEPLPQRSAADGSQVIVSSRREVREEAEARLAEFAAMRPDSGRNDVLNALAYWFGRRLACFPGGERAGREWLKEACEDNGLADDPTSGGRAQVERTIESGLAAGKTDPVILQSRRSYRQARSRLVQRILYDHG